MSDEPIERLVRSLKDDLAAVVAERDLLRSALLDILVVESLDSAHLLADGALNAVTSELDQAVEYANLRDERDRLRAVVDALKTVAFMAQFYLDARSLDPQSPARTDLERSLDAVRQLDVSANIGGHEAQGVGRRFRSNACIHEEHEQCEKVCPFCDDSCGCACHPWNMRFDGDETSAGALPCHHCGAGVKGCLEADQPCCPDCHHGGAIRHRTFSAGGAS